MYSVTGKKEMSEEQDEVKEWIFESQVQKINKDSEHAEESKEQR